MNLEKVLNTLNETKYQLGKIDQSLQSGHGLLYHEMLERRERQYSKERLYVGCLAWLKVHNKPEWQEYFLWFAKEHFQWKK